MCSPDNPDYRGVRNIRSLETKDIGLSILVYTCSCCFGRHIAFLETCKCVPVLSPDWRQHRSKSQVDAFTCFGRILNLLEELLLPDRIVECRNGLCSTGQISAQRHIQVAEFRYACRRAFNARSAKRNAVASTQSIPSSMNSSIVTGFSETFQTLIGTFAKGVVR